MNNNSSPGIISYSLSTLSLLPFMAIGSTGREKAGNMTAKDFFLAEGSLTWWAIGASLIASNISAEQFIGMSGNRVLRWALPLQAMNGWLRLLLIIVAVLFMPIYLKNKIYTMPQFLKQRYNETVAMIMAVFWLLLYVVVNLTSILYLGAIAISGISGLNIYACDYHACHLCHCHHAGWHESDRLYRCDTGFLFSAWGIGHYLYCT